MHLDKPRGHDPASKASRIISDRGLVLGQLGRIVISRPLLRTMPSVRTRPVNYTNLHSYRGVGGLGGGSPPRAFLVGPWRLLYRLLVRFVW